MNELELLRIVNNYIDYIYIYIYIYIHIYIYIYIHELFRNTNIG